MFPSHDIKGEVTEVRKTAYNKMLATINEAYSDTAGAAHAIKDITSQKDGVYADIIDAICKTKESYEIFVTNITQEPKRLLNKLNEADAARNTKSTSTTYHTTVRELLKIKITDAGTSDLTADDIRDSINDWETKESYEIFVTNITQEPKRLLNKLNEADAHVS